MTIYVYQVDRSTTEDDLLNLFEEFGEVETVSVQGIDDLESETLFAEIEMAFEDDALIAIDELNGERVDGRILYVSQHPLASAKKTEVEEEEEDTFSSEVSWQPMERKRPREGAPSGKKPRRRR
ncbi:MAG: RNA-binding protein [Bacteroidota bacterium]